MVEEMKERDWGERKMYESEDFVCVEVLRTSQPNGVMSSAGLNPRLPGLQSDCTSK